MEHSLPVFSSGAEVELWKSIAAAEGITHVERKEKQYRILFQWVTELEGPVPSPILERMIMLQRTVGGEKWIDDVDRLVSLQRKGDCRASLAAALCLAKEGHNTAALGYLDSISQVSDRARFSKAKGDILMTMDNKDGAVRAYADALRYDPLDTETYRKMAVLVPDRNWMAICACERMFAGLEFERPPAEPAGPHMELFAIYDTFFNGDRGRAVAMLNDHPLLRDPSSYDFTLLAARMAFTLGNIADARAFYEETLRRTSEFALACEAASSYLEGKPDTALALQKFRAAEGDDPGNIRVIRGLVRAYGMSGKAPDAVSVLSVFLKTEFAELNEYDYAADRMVDLGFTDNAIRIQEQILFNYPNDPQAHLVMSKASLQKADFITAKQHARAALRLIPDDPAACQQLSNVFRALKVRRLARRYARDAVALGPTSVAANTALMDVYNEDGDVQKTMQTAEKILSFDPDNAHAREILSNIMIERAMTKKDDIIPEVDDEQDIVRLVARLESESRFDEAQSICLKNKDLFSRCPVLFQFLGNAQYACGRYLQASASFAEAVTHDPDSAVLWHSKGMADEKIGDLLSASEAFDRAVVLDQGNPDYWVSRGTVNQALGNKNLAIDSFNRAIELDADAAYPLVCKASVISSMGRYDEALGFIEIAEVYVPDNDGITVAKMKVLNAAGRYADARAIGEDAISRYNVPPMIAQIVAADIGLGDTDDALARINRGLLDYPDDPDILRAQRDLNVSIENWEEAVRICIILTNMYPEDRESRTVLADTFVKIGKPEEANKIYRELQNSAPLPDVDDQGSIFSIAKSLLKVDDINGATRLAEMLIETDPRNDEYIRFRVMVFEAAGNIREAEQFLTEYCETYPDSWFLKELLGDVKARKGDKTDAIACYSECLGMIGPGDDEQRALLYVRIAKCQEDLRLNQDAIQSYRQAVQINEFDTESSRHLANLLLLADQKAEAVKVMTTQISAEESPASYALLATIYQAMNNPDSVRYQYRAFLKFDNPAESDVLSVMAALNRVGLNTEAESYRRYLNGIRSSAADVSSDVAPSVKRCAERIMRRAYMLEVGIDDPAARDLSDSDINDAAVQYLKDIPEFGEVIPWQFGFQRFEDLTKNIVFAPRGTHSLENLTVEIAFMAGKAKDSDEAKQLVSYVRQAQTSPIPTDIPEGLRRIAAGQTPGTSVEQIMRECGCGLMSARIIQTFI